MLKENLLQSIDSWIEYLHPRLGCIEIARIEDEDRINMKGYKIIKKVVNSEIVPIEAE